MCPRTGRPKSKKPKSIQLTVRVDEETLGKLDEVVKVNSETRVQVIRKGIEIQYEYIKK